MSQFRQSLLIVSVLFVLAVSGYSQQSTPKASIESFYKFDRANSQVFNRENIEARKDWFTEELYEMFQNELRREAEHLKNNPDDKPFFGDGLPFQPTNEVCRVGNTEFRREFTLKVLGQSTRRSLAHATFKYPKKCTEGGGPVVHRILLLKVGDKWLIDDVEYDAGWKLKEILSRKEY